MDCLRALLAQGPLLSLYFWLTATGDPYDLHSYPCRALCPQQSLQTHSSADADIPCDHIQVTGETEASVRSRRGGTGAFLAHNLHLLALRSLDPQVRSFWILRFRPDPFQTLYEHLRYFSSRHPLEEVPISVNFWQPVSLLVECGYNSSKNRECYHTRELE